MAISTLLLTFAETTPKKEKAEDPNLFRDCLPPFVAPKSLSTFVSVFSLNYIFIFVKYPFPLVWQEGLTQLLLLHQLPTIPRGIFSQVVEEAVEVGEPQ